jgi:hypothetical protein
MVGEVQVLVLSDALKTRSSSSPARPLVLTTTLVQHSSCVIGKSLASCHPYLM